MSDIKNFIQRIIEDDLSHGLTRVVTRFPPEPNGYLHIGHVKSICLNFSLAEQYNGTCHLRFDDTNPSKENEEFIRAIREAIHWLGYDWKNHCYHASDYFPHMYQYAVYLIQRGLAYVDHQTHDTIREQRGTLTAPGQESPYRKTTVEENQKIFSAMKMGNYADGDCVLRLKIDMGSPNLNMRDPVIYRIKHEKHHHVDNQWCIYPLYDYAHCISDALEGISHSLCTLEFQDHRPLYNWILDRLQEGGFFQNLPKQIEFSRLNVTHTVTSKRKLQNLIDNKIVSGWDDPRLPTVAGLRRRGFTPQALRDFCARVGITKSDNWVDYSYLEECLREYLNTHSMRRIAVIEPIKIIITNYPKDRAADVCLAPNHPQDLRHGTRHILFGHELYIERTDFMEKSKKGFYKLTVGGYVRLKYAYVIICDEVIYNDQGEPETLLCRYLPETKSGSPQTSDLKVKGTIHWLYAPTARKAQIHLYSHLFTCEHIPDSENIDALINQDSEMIVHALVEPDLENSQPEENFQFERLGYFVADREHHKPPTHLHFNRTTELKSSRPT